MPVGPLNKPYPLSDGFAGNISQASTLTMISFFFLPLVLPFSPFLFSFLLKTINWHCCRMAVLSFAGQADGQRCFALAQYLQRHRLTSKRKSRLLTYLAGEIEGHIFFTTQKAPTPIASHRPVNVVVET